MSFNNMTVRAKLTMAFGGLALLVFLVSGFAVKALGDLNAQFEGYINGVNARTQLAAEVRTAVDGRAIAARNLVIVTSPQDMAIEKAAVEKAHQDVTTKLAKLKAMAEVPGVSPEARRMIGEIDKVEQLYAPVALGIVDLALKGKREEASTRITNDCRPLLRALAKAANDYAEFSADRSVKLIAEVETNYLAQRNTLIGAALFALIAAIVAGAVITRSLVRALGAEPTELCDAVSRVADGDLATPLNVSSGDTVSVLAALDRMQTSLIRVVSSVRQGSDGLATASAEIAQGNNDLSARTEQQASALEETAASMEQLSATVNQNADSARQANQLAMSASSVAVQGGVVVGQVVETMKGINDASRKIADIISVIDGIAFQTNILALNAAVEAARAGEQGRGFAVVASEVRSLAGRSAEAAKEIKALIGASVERVDHGTALVDKAGTTMAEVVDSIKRVTDLMGEISAASNEQAAGVSQIGEAVTQMDQVTQQNAALVEEMAAAASSLKGQAQELVEVVSIFNLGSNGGSQNRPSRSAPSAFQRPIAPKPAPPRLAPKASPKPTPPRPALAKPATAPSKGPARAKAAAAGGDDDWETF